MNIINKFKSAYLQKLIQGYFANNEINELQSLISKEISNPYIVEPWKAFYKTTLKILSKANYLKIIFIG